MKSTKAYSPGHITGFFYINDKDKNPLKRGSLGAGFSTKNGVYTEIQINKDLKSPEIFINNYKSNNPEVSKELINLFFNKYKNSELNQLSIKHTIELPMGCGFGTSGAGALSLALCINKHFKLGLSDTEAAQYAHIAEINCKTGLGTIIGECTGNFEYRVKAGAPGIGKIINYNTDSSNLIAVFLVLGSYSTKEALNNVVKRKAINKYGKKSLKKLTRNPDINNFLTLSKEFTEKISLLPKEILESFEYLNNLENFVSMMMFGNGLFTVINKEKYEDYIKILVEHLNKNEIYFKLNPEEYNFEDNKAIIFSSEIAKTGGYVLNENQCT